MLAKWPIVLAGVALPAAASRWSAAQVLLPGEPVADAHRPGQGVSAQAIFRVHAATFNAGNQEFDDNASWKKTLHKLIEGHEGTHLVLLGFQELYDGGLFRAQRLGAWVQEHLWRSWGSLGQHQRWEQRFDSGRICHRWRHYDTILYAFAAPSNLLSDFKIEPVQYSRSPWCKRDGNSTGCSVSLMGNRLECGKVVNILVFDVKPNSGDTQRVCLLNTHFSFEGKGLERALALEKAKEEAKFARCDSIIFVGDFNSRLHCVREDRTKKDRSLMQEHPRVTFDTFCDSNNCKLARKDAQYDEMNQLLSQKYINCFEKEKSTWTSMSYTNPLLNSSSSTPDFREPEVKGVEGLSFPPTYKVKQSKRPADKGQNLSHFTLSPSRGFPGGTVTYVSDAEPKHNPGWTDRVLVSAKDWEAYSYSALPLEDFESDHMPVVAEVALRMR